MVEGLAPACRETFLGGRVAAYVGDLTDHAVDAIVNAANSSLMGGGGIDGAIHRRGGPRILEACREIRRSRWPGGLPPGEAVATVAGDLPARWVIHTVGPVYGRHGGREPELLAACYRNCLVEAQRLGLESIAFPAISTGVYRYPQGEAAQVVSRTLAACLAENEAWREIRLVFFQESQFEAFMANQQFGARP